MSEHLHKASSTLTQAESFFCTKSFRVNGLSLFSFLSTFSPDLGFLSLPRAFAEEIKKELQGEQRGPVMTSVLPTKTMATHLCNLESDKRGALGKVRKTH